VTGGTHKTARARQPQKSSPFEHSRSPARVWRRLARPTLLLVLGGVGIYLLLPSLLPVFGSWRSLDHLDWPFAILAVACEAASFVCLWKLDRIALRVRAWFPVAAAQLSGNAAGRVLPGGGATATGLSVAMLRRAGVDAGQAVVALGTSSALQLATAFALPLLACRRSWAARPSTTASQSRPISARHSSCCWSEPARSRSPRIVRSSWRRVQLSGC
jgi:uncharacterized membrane protein YbhN (UPF0104 family)